MTVKKTIAIQVDDPVFLAQYEKRQKESGLKVKDYLLGLIKADIQSHSMTQAETATQNAQSDNRPEQTAVAQESGKAPSQTDVPVQEETQAESLADSDTPEETQAESLADSDTPEETQAESLAESDTPEETQAESLAESDTPEETQAESLADSDTPEKTQAESLAESDAPEETQEKSKPVYSGEITNLFVKITKDQRAAIDARKAETGESANALLNRLIGDFLDGIRSGTAPEGFYETYDHFSAIAGSCDTTCSAKIPVEMHKELTDYLEGTSRSRNVLIATLVHDDLQSQEMTEEQGQGMTL